MNKININTIFKVLISALYVGVEASSTMIVFSPSFISEAPVRIFFWCFGTIFMIMLWAFSVDSIDVLWK